MRIELDLPIPPELPANTGPIKLQGMFPRFLVRSS